MELPSAPDPENERFTAPLHDTKPSYIENGPDYFKLVPPPSSVLDADMEHFRDEINKIFNPVADTADPEVDAVTYVTDLFTDISHIEAPGPHRRHAKANVWRMIFGRRSGGGRHRRDL